MAYEVVMTAKAAVELLIHIARDLPTKYRNRYPFNLGYWDGEAFSWDCWNLWPKSIVWGWKENRTIGYFAKQNKSTGLGDWTGMQIMATCTEKSSNFSKLTPGEFLLSTDKGHAGAYIGEFIINSKCYNVVEATEGWNTNKVIFSYVSNTGLRYRYKGGEKARVGWIQHGKLPWIDYSVQPEPEPTPPTPTPQEDIYYTVVRGDNLTKIAAKFNTTVSQLVAWNNIKNPNLILVGQKLIVGKRSPYPPQPEPEKQYYVVKRGDNLTKIAKQFGTTVAQLCEWNNIKNANLILVGQVLRVK